MRPESAPYHSPACVLKGHLIQFAPKVRWISTEVLEGKMIIKRDAYVDTLIRLSGNGRVKVLTGIRRCGKSFLLGRLLKKRLTEDGLDPRKIVEVALDVKKNERLRDANALYGFLAKRLKAVRGRAVVFIDELQMALPESRDAAVRKKAEDSLYGMLNEFKGRPHTDIYVTGSNSSFLSDDVATMFRGRASIVRVNPLSFAEYLPACRKDELSAWKDYLVYGGMPEGISYSDVNDRRIYLHDLFDAVYFRDIIERNAPLADGALLRDLSSILMSGIGGLSNPAKLVNSMRTILGIKVDYQVLRRHLGYLENAYLVEEAKRWNVKGRHYLDYPVKYYAVDIGLRNAWLGYRQMEQPHMMENVIFSELRAAGYPVDVGMMEIDSRNGGKREKRQHEIDFVVNLPDSRVYIQSAWMLPTDEKREQETLPLLKTGDSFKKIVVSGDYHDAWKDDSGIVHVGVIPFLLDLKNLIQT